MKIQDAQQAAQNHLGTCPNCGHCPHCGRSNFRPWGYWPPYYPYRPYGVTPYPLTWWTQIPSYSFTAGAGAN